jgi:hypothetical protein
LRLISDSAIEGPRLTSDLVEISEQGERRATGTPSPDWSGEEQMFEDIVRVRAKSCGNALSDVEALVGARINPHVPGPISRFRLPTLGLSKTPLPTGGGPKALGSNVWLPM